MSLQIPVKDASPFLKKYAKRLEALEIYTYQDFLYHIPFRYEDYSVKSKINQIQSGETITVIGTVKEIKNTYTRQRFQTMQKAIITDETGEIHTIWFNQPYLTKMIHSGDTIAISGKVEKNSNKLQFTAPEYELITIDPVTNQPSETLHTARLVPIYHETKGISSKFLRRQIHKIIQENIDAFTEHFPEKLIKQLGFLDYLETIKQIHFPSSLQIAKQAKDRLSFEELFFSQVTAMKRREMWKGTLVGQSLKVTQHNGKIQKFIQSLPFTLTTAQQKALQHIFSDMQKQEPMNRLLEGDVGSGKTIVAAIAMYVASLNNYQSVLMAPTEILAQQHFATISKFLEPFGVKVDLITGSHKSQATNPKSQKKKKMDLGDLDFRFDILVGTHAVLSKKINFDNLGLVVIDEQQRFGVGQRALIRAKGKNPHFLTMTATPIPRTIALTMYGDLDLSLLDELPQGRKTIKTWFVPATKREGAYRWIEKELSTTHSQAFIVCPFIEESESMTTVKAATKEFEYLQKNVFSHLKLGLLHGKMKAKEKDEILEKFRNHEFDILIATPVVEVGIDIPNATIIIIEAADRFGLSQLHQLRGRVGRGDKQSYCLLFTESTKPQTISRLRAMESMHIGAQLAEFDLQLRGAGDMYGTAQHGQTFFKIASFADVDLIEQAKQTAERIFPELDHYPKLLEKLQHTDSEISPD